jgi:hypothetical protein
MSETPRCSTPEECLRIHPQEWAEHVARFRARARERMQAALEGAEPGNAEHWRLFAEVVELDPRDWDGYGLLDRWEGKYEGSSGDCSSGCLHYRPLQGELAADWGVCTNPASHRVGKLTFEHQGCPAFEPEPFDLAGLASLNLQK